ncbi:MAG: hypothetical protein J2P49_02610 [Methylocapsa sp.]|nr:hypothetical protein [Methylocapsa sp.]
MRLKLLVFVTVLAAIAVTWAWGVRSIGHGQHVAQLPASLTHGDEVVDFEMHPID